MTNQKHPITPPAELVAQWKRTAPNWYWANETEHYHYITLCAAQWGADQELEACCEWVDWKWSGIKNRELRAARRPKPPSLKEQALEQLGCIQTDLNKFDMGISTDTIRRALEALPE
jgi:hypothetical protein